ncbi:MAG TPA: hypothetical protein VLF66_00845, partial [Thermoanaerobaculia bacterium]|nr:hypothetical protein [Thermoanaerobaculia bacterium]
DFHEPLMLLVELGLGQAASSEGRFRARTPPELMALLTLLSFELLLRAPGGTELRILSRRFARCVAVTGLEGLTLQSMALRSRYLTLLALFAPLPVLARLAATWIGPAREESLLPASSGDEAGWTFQATPREYRLPLLGMFAVLERHPGLLEQAAESLWSRQLNLDGDPALAQRVARESAYRFRYLMQAAGTGLTSWTSGNLQVQRLEQVLSRLFLEDPGVSERRSDGPEGRARPRGPTPDDMASALHAVVFEIQRGWIFGSPSPRSFDRLWSTAEALFRRAASPHSPSVQWSSLKAVPWELLLLITPAIEGRSGADRERYAEAAQRLWENDLLDPVVLIELLRLRLGTGRLGPVPGATVASLPEAPVRREIRLRLAWLIRWLTESVQSEDAEGVPLPTLLAQRLLPVIRSWLPVAEEEAEHLVQALIRLREHDGTTVRKIIEDWLQSPVAESRGMPLHLSELDPPPDGDAPHSDAPILSALDWRARWKHAIESRAHGARRYSNDVLLWSIGWSDRFRAPERRKMGQGLADLIRGEAERQSFDWLRVAAAIQERDRLRDLVDRRLREGENSRGLAGFVFRTLEETERGWPERWRSSRDFSLGYLAAFARDVVDEDLPFLERALDLESLTSRGCEGAVKVLVALLAEAPVSNKDRASIHKRWIEQLARAIDRGANGRGELGALNGKLSPIYRQKLQDNLIRQLERDSGADFVGQPGATRRLADVVGWVHETLEGALRAGDGSEATVLTDLEERLVEGVASPHAALADACIASVMEFDREFPDFADRNRARLRRVLLQVDGRGSYRNTSRFARNLATLRELVASA